MLEKINLALDNVGSSTDELDLELKSQVRHWESGLLQYLPVFHHEFLKKYFNTLNNLLYALTDSSRHRDEILNFVDDIEGKTDHAWSLLRACVEVKLKELDQIASPELDLENTTDRSADVKEETKMDELPASLSRIGEFPSGFFDSSPTNIPGI